MIMQIIWGEKISKLWLSQIPGESEGIIAEYEIQILFSQDVC